MIDLHNIMRQRFISLFVVLCIIGCLCPAVPTARAKDTPISIKGHTYEFSPDAHYEFSTATPSGSDTFGTFTVLGGLKSTGSKDGVPAYSVTSGSIGFYYAYEPSQLNAAETEWHLTEDKTKKIDTISLDDNIANGAIVVQSSKDGANWITDVTMPNVFTAASDLSDAIYTTADIQLENGCYYRVIVAYKLQIKTGEKKIGPITKAVIEEKKIAEVYELYAISGEVAGNTTSAATAPRKELGQKVNTGKDNGYSGNNAIDKDDPHYGWDLGTFVVNGYTSEVSGSSTPIFLKTIGDKVTLWFTLKQDINHLNGNNALAIAEDTNGYDQYFEVPQTNFKRGTLIIRYTDHEGKVHEPVIYTDFLAANATTSADTRVQLFEEGDYEVSLDYEIKNNPRQVGPVSVIPTYTNYKIYFAFSIRNSNCMVYPFDITTGSELDDNDITATGFRLDLANSKYLTIEIEKSNLTADPNGLLSANQRSNQAAREGIPYTDEGIYTFTVTNPSTEEQTEKTIYVGTSKYLRALSSNHLTVDDLNEKIRQGAVINDDGTIVDYIPPEETVPPVREAESVASVIGSDTPDLPDEDTAADVLAPTEDETPQDNSSTVLIVVAFIVVAGSAAVVWVLKKKKEVAGK